MNKTPARIVSIALVAAAPVFAAGTTQGDSSTRHGSAHQLAADFKGAMHKLGDATRHALHRADAALHRASAKRDKDA